MNNFKSNFLSKIWNMTTSVIPKEKQVIKVNFSENAEFLNRFIEIVENYTVCLSDTQRVFHVAIARLMELFNLLDDFKYTIILKIATYNLFN